MEIKYQNFIKVFQTKCPHLTLKTDQTNFTQKRSI